VGGASHDPAAAIAAPWLPLDELTGSVRVLRDRIAAVRSALGAAAGCGPQEVEFRIAASVTQLGIAARLISPPLGLAGTSRALLRGARAGWQPTLGGAFRLSRPAGSALRPGTGRDDEDVLAAGLREEVVDGPVRAVTEMVAAMSVPAVVLWGNVASAVHRAAAVVATAPPRPGARAPGVCAAAPVPP